MEINGTNPLAGPQKIQRLDQAKHSDRAEKNGGVQPEPDRLELSIQSREISQLDEMIRSTPDVREERIAEVRQAIENGTYNVKAEKIAEKIIGGNLLDEIF